MGDNTDAFDKVLQALQAISPSDLPIVGKNLHRFLTQVLQHKKKARPNPGTGMQGILSRLLNGWPPFRNQGSTTSMSFDSPDSSFEHFFADALAAIRSLCPQAVAGPVSSSEQTVGGSSEVSQEDSENSITSIPAFFLKYSVSESNQQLPELISSNPALLKNFQALLDRHQTACKAAPSLLGLSHQPTEDAFKNAFQKQRQEVLWLSAMPHTASYKGKLKRLKKAERQLRLAGILTPVNDVEYDGGLLARLNAFSELLEGDHFSDSKSKDSMALCKAHIKAIERALRPQEGWHLGGLLPRTSSELTLYYAKLIASLKALAFSDTSIKEDRKKVQAAITYLKHLLSADVEAAAAPTDEDHSEAIGTEQSDGTVSEGAIVDSEARTDPPIQALSGAFGWTGIDQQSKSLLESFKDITQQMIALDQGEVIEGQQRYSTSLARKMLTGSYYHGKHDDAVYRNVFKRMGFQFLYTLGFKGHYQAAGTRRTQKHFVDAMERLALIDSTGTLLEAVQRVLNEEVSSSKSHFPDYEKLILKLHGQFEQVDAGYRRALQDQYQDYEKKLYHSYADTAGDDGSVALIPAGHEENKGSISSKTKRLIELLLMGESPEIKDKIQKLKGEIRVYNAEKVGKQFFRKLVPSPKEGRARVDLSGLLKDCAFYQARLQKQRAAYQRNLKALKKPINRLSEELGVPLRIVNFERETKVNQSTSEEAKKAKKRLKKVFELEQVAIALRQELAEAQDNSKKNRTQQLITDFREKIEALSLEEEQKQALKEFLELQNGENEGTRFVAEDQSQAPTLDDFMMMLRDMQMSSYRVAVSDSVIGHADKQHRRAVKKRNQEISSTASTMLGIGEGAVAAVGFALFFASIIPVWGLIPLATLVFIGGFSCNKLLVMDDSYSVLNAIFLGELFQDENGDDLPLWEKIVISLFGTLSLGVGISYGALGANCLTKTILLPVFSMLVAHRVALIAALALSTGPLGATAIGMTAIFFVVLGDLFKNRKERWQGIKSYFKADYAIDWDRWEKLKANHNVLVALSDYLLRVTMSALKLAFAVALTAMITIMSIGLFYKSSLGLLKLLTTNSWTGMAASIATGVNAFVSGIFGVQKNMNTINVLTLGGVVVFPFKTIFSMLGLGLACFVEMPIRCLVNALSFIVTKGCYAPCDLVPNSTLLSLSHLFSFLDGIAKKVNEALWSPVVHPGAPVGEAPVKKAAPVEAEQNNLGRLSKLHAGISKFLSPFVIGVVSPNSASQGLLIGSSGAPFFNGVTGNIAQSMAVSLGVSTATFNSATPNSIGVNAAAEARFVASVELAQKQVSSQSAQEQRGASVPNFFSRTLKQARGEQTVVMAEAEVVAEEKSCESAGGS